MARNEEKALTLFNKWHTFKKDFHADAHNRKPLSASECQSLPEAEKWRRDIIKDLKKKVSLIQNAGLGEHRIRELNDEINKHMRQKHYWEIRIRELGGGDYRNSKGTQYYEIEGKELPGASGYRYYGAARELPGVRELFAEHEEKILHKRKTRSRADIYKNITPDYYGYRDDDDGVLVPKEKEQEKRLWDAEILKFTNMKRQALSEVHRSGGVYGKEKLDLLRNQETLSDSEAEELVLMERLVSGESGTFDVARQVPQELPAADATSAMVQEKKRRLLDDLSS